MKKLLIASLVLGILIVFTGVASAQPYWWLSSKEITLVLTGTKEKTNSTTGNTALATKTGTFTGYMVMETAARSVPATNYIDQIFLCGTVTSTLTGTTTAFELLFYPFFGSIATDTITRETHVHTETGHIYAAGDTAFIIQSAGTPAGPVSPSPGPADLWAPSVTYDLNDATEILHISINGTVSGAFPQVTTTTNPISDTIFTGAFTTELNPTTDTAICCCNGIITTNTSCPCS